MNRVSLPNYVRDIYNMKYGSLAWLPYFVMILIYYLYIFKITFVVDRYRDFSFDRNMLLW